MISNIFDMEGNRIRPIDVAELYLHALRYIAEGKEEKAGYALNLVRDTLLENAHSTNLTDDHLQTLMPDLTVKKFMGLYGDYKYNDEPRKERLYNESPRRPQTTEWHPISSAWIKDTGLIDMVASHITQLGDDEDRETCALFLQRTRSQFSLKVPAPEMELVA